jgi:hypothetical protein
MDEFYKQGDEERRKSMPVSAFMDRVKPAEAKCQLGFIDFIVGPIFEVWASFLPEMKITIENLEANRNFWKKRQDINTRVNVLETLVLDSLSNDNK